MSKKIPCEVYSRVVGYFRPVNNWNDGKKTEYDDRKVYDVSVSMGSTPQSSVVAEAQPVIQEVVTTTDGSTVQNIVAYKAFGFPDCKMCLETKDFLNTQQLDGSTYDLHDEEDKKLFMSYYKDHRADIKRGDDGATLLPVVIFLDGEGKVTSIAQSETEAREVLN